MCRCVGVAPSSRGRSAAPAGSSLSSQSRRYRAAAANAGPQPIAAEDRDRPSRHGLILGEALADLAKAGAVGTGLLDAMCATCAFRSGCATNMMAATGTAALDCLLTGEVFGCHHGMKDGEPTRACAGWFAARQAPDGLLLSAVQTVAARLAAATGPDEVREGFDAWVGKVDPNNLLDNYQQGRAFLRDSGSDPQGENSRSEVEGEASQSGLREDGGIAQ